MARQGNYFRTMTLFINTIFSIFFFFLVPFIFSLVTFILSFSYSYLCRVTFIFPSLSFFFYLSHHFYLSLSLVSFILLIHLFINTQYFSLTPSLWLLSSLQPFYHPLIPSLSLSSRLFPFLVTHPTLAFILLPLILLPHPYSLSTLSTFLSLSTTFLSFHTSHLSSLTFILSLPLQA